MPNIFITRHIPQAGYDRLAAAFGPEAITSFDEDRATPRDVLLKGVAGADAIFAILTEKMDAEVFDAAGSQLKVVANMAVGYDNVDVPAATERGIPITNTPGVLTETTADLTWALILAAARRTGEAERFVRSGHWHSWSPTLLLGVDVYEKTLGIYGMGRIGKAVARRAAGFGMKVLYHNRTRLSPGEEQALNATLVDFPTLLKESDILSPHCPLTPDTRHAFSTVEFTAMKDSVVFINTTRGPVVDEAALAQALQNHSIFSAGIDVFEEEPKIHPELLKCENAVLLPHLGSASEATRGRMATIAADNIITRLNGDTPPNCINPEAL